MKMEDKHIPTQEEGSSMDAVEKTTFATSHLAGLFYEVARERLLDVSHWHAVSGLPVVTFQMTDRDGKELSGQLKEGQIIRIDLAGPGTVAGDGYDWVEAEEVSEHRGAEEELLTITLRPCTNPGSGDPDIAHFLKRSATSTLQVCRKGTLVYAGFYGRNEVPNTSVDSLADKVRNFMVANASRWGLAYPHWKKLVKGLVEP